MVSSATRDDMMSDLATAIYAGDLDAAREHLDGMWRAGINTDLILRAKRKVHPLPPSPDAKAIPLPAPGADPRTHFGGQNFKGWA